MEYKEGDKVTISYNPKKPQQISQPFSIILPTVLLSLGCILLICGILSLIKAFKKIKALKAQDESLANEN